MGLKEKSLETPALKHNNVIVFARMILTRPQFIRQTKSDKVTSFWLMMHQTEVSVSFFSHSQGSVHTLCVSA